MSVSGGLGVASSEEGQLWVWDADSGEIRVRDCKFITNLLQSYLSGIKFSRSDCQIKKNYLVSLASFIDSECTPIQCAALPGGPCG